MPENPFKLPKMAIPKDYGKTPFKLKMKTPNAPGLGSIKMYFNKSEEMHPLHEQTFSSYDDAHNALTEHGFKWHSQQPFGTMYNHPSKGLLVLRTINNGTPHMQYQAHHVGLVKMQLLKNYGNADPISQSAQGAVPKPFKLSKMFPSWFSELRKVDDGIPPDWGSKPQHNVEYPLNQISTNAGLSSWMRGRRAPRPTHTPGMWTTEDITKEGSHPLHGTEYATREAGHNSLLATGAMHDENIFYQHPEYGTFILKPNKWIRENPNDDDNGRGKWEYQIVHRGPSKNKNV